MYVCSSRYSSTRSVDSHHWYHMDMYWHCDGWKQSEKVMVPCSHHTMPILLDRYQIPGSAIYLLHEYLLPSTERTRNYSYTRKSRNCFDSKIAELAWGW
jgi:hypothetical protein